MAVPTDLKYTKSHEWVKIEGDLAVAGITEFAVKALSDLVYVDLPELADLTEKGHPYAEVESVKAVADVLAPVSGEVEEINEDLVDQMTTWRHSGFSVHHGVRLDASTALVPDPVPDCECSSGLSAEAGRMGLGCGHSVAAPRSFPSIC